MIVSIHQPQYLPWLPYFLKVAESDRFILLDSVEFQKNGLQNRNQIKTSQGAQWLTVPVRHRLGQRIDQVEIDNHSDWRKKHWQAIQQSYRKTSVFDAYASELERTYEREWSSLNELNIHLFHLVLGWMDVKTTVMRSSEMKARGKGSKLILDLCLEASATHYIAGTGALDYLEEFDFTDAGIEIAYRPPTLPEPYPQPYPEAGFINTLSALDTILSCGDEWRDHMSPPAPVSEE